MNSQDLIIVTVCLVVMDNWDGFSEEEKFFCSKFFQEFTRMMIIHPNNVKQYCRGAIDRSKESYVPGE